MKPFSTSLLTICGLEELEHHRSRGVTHVLSLLDPEWPEPEAFSTYGSHHRTTLKFNDAIEPEPGLILPTSEHVEAILAFGDSMAVTATPQHEPHLLIHCHMGVSRSTAAMAILMAQSKYPETEEWIFSRLLELRPQAWPNSLMIEFADELLGRDGRLKDALAGLYASQLKKQPQIEQFMRAHGRLREIEMAKRFW